MYVSIRLTRVAVSSLNIVVRWGWYALVYYVKYNPLFYYHYLLVHNIIETEVNTGVLFFFYNKHILTCLFGFEFFFQIETKAKTSRSLQPMTNTTWLSLTKRVGFFFLAMEPDQTAFFKLSLLSFRGISKLGSVCHVYLLASHLFLCFFLCFVLQTI